MSKARVREQGKVAWWVIVQTAVEARPDLTTQPRYEVPGDHVGYSSAVIDIGWVRLSPWLWSRFGHGVVKEQLKRRRKAILPKNCRNYFLGDPQYFIKYSTNAIRKHLDRDELLVEKNYHWFLFWCLFLREFIYHFSWAGAFNNWRFGRDFFMLCVPCPALPNGVP